MPEPVEVRQVQVPVPTDYRQQVEFVDAERGYALFTGCKPAPADAQSQAPDCSVLLFITTNGGRTWSRLRHPHPHPQAKHHQLETVGEKLVLFVESDGWYVSSDAGLTFEHLPAADQPPDAYRGLFGRFQVCCDIDVQPRVVEWLGYRFRPLPMQPPVPGLGSVAYASGRLVAAGLRGGRPYASVSRDAGRSWSVSAVPAAGGDLVRLEARVAVDGDAWLVGYTEDRPRFPRLWRWVDSGWSAEWRSQSATGHPERFTSVVPLGGGLLAVTGPDGAGLVTEGRYTVWHRPGGDGYLRMLDDGTLFTAEAGDGAAYLGTGRLTDRRWTMLVLERM